MRGELNLDREWEVWHERRVANLSKSWGNPNECAKGKIPKKGRTHWGLIEKATSLVEGGSVLDVGCGLGHLFSLLRDTDYLGIDTSEPMIRRAREYFPADRCKFQIGDAYDLSSLPEFDTVVAIGLIIHLPNPEKLLRQLWSRARICMIFSAWVGWRQTVNKKIEGKRTVFERRYTMKQYNEMFSKLDGVREAEKHTHTYSRGNYFFKLWRDKSRMEHGRCDEDGIKE